MLQIIPVNKRTENQVDTDTIKYIENIPHDSIAKKYNRAIEKRNILNSVTKYTILESEANNDNSQDLIDGQSRKKITSEEYQMAEKLREELFLVIEKTMEKENISQAEVARRIKAQRYNVNKIMRKKYPVSLDFLVKMAESIGLDVSLKVGKEKD